MSGDLLHLDGFRPGLAVLPVRHGSLPFAEAARRAVLGGGWSTVALDLPAFCAEEWLEAVRRLPVVEAATWIQGGRRWVLAADPCDPCTAAARTALEERIPIAFLDHPAEPGPEDDPDLPDASAVESIGAAEYCGICLPFLDGKRHESLAARAAWIATALRSLRPGPVLAVVRLALLPDLLRRLAGDGPPRPVPEWDEPGELETLPVEPRHLAFCLGEWPFVAQEVERNRMDPLADPLPPTRTWTRRVLRWARDRHLGRRRAKVLPLHELRVAERFAHRLARISGSDRPSLWDLVQAARASSGDSFAAAVLEAARYHGWEPSGDERLLLGPSRARAPGDEVRPWSNRLLPAPVRWEEIRLRRDPDPEEAARFLREWKPSSLCSHLPEDVAIERFNLEVRDRARSSNPSGREVSRPFESSLLDGLDLRETVRHFWKGEVWVKERPARTLRLDAVVIAFDESGAGYPHRGTWYAEHAGESTLLFYATDPSAEPVGPGILRSRYGGLALLFPPRRVPDIFSIPGPPPLGARGPLETLVAGACLFARERTVAFASWEAPGLRLRSIAREAGKRLVHVPLSGFPASTIEKLRTFHVLDGKEVRGWADRFIQG